MTEYKIVGYDAQTVWTAAELKKLVNEVDDLRKQYITELDQLRSKYQGEFDSRITSIKKILESV